MRTHTHVILCGCVPDVIDLGILSWKNFHGIQLEAGGEMGLTVEALSLLAIQIGRRVDFPIEVQHPSITLTIKGLVCGTRKELSTAFDKSVVQKRNKSTIKYAR